MTQVFKNNVTGVTNGAITDVATSVTLLDASNFPAPTGGQYYLVTFIGLDGNGNESSWEIARVTAKASNTLTITRAQESTAGFAWPSGTKVQMRLTAATVVSPDSTATLTNKTIAYASNTLTGVQPVLVSGTSIKTVNSTSLLGSGDIAVQPTLVSGTSIKTINGTSLLGSGDLTAGDVTLTGTQTLTNKTLSGAVLNDGYTEEVFAVSGTTPALSPANGSIQTWTLTANSTPTAEAWASGQSITLMINDGSARTITWTSLAVTWKTNGGSAPTLNTSGYTVIAMWKVGTTIYGARVGDA